MHRDTYHKRARKHLLDSCESCSSTDALQAHHLDGDITNNAPANIQTLCKSCHVRGHWEAKRQEESSRWCEHCDAEIARRRTNGSLRLRKDFLVQRFCSKRCATASRYSPPCAE